MKANCVVIHCSTIFLFSELQRIWMPPSLVIKVQSIYIVGSKYYFPLCLLVPLSKPFQFTTEQTNDETSVTVFWHFQKIQHVISNLEGLNLHPNMSSVKLTQALSFVLWGKNKFKKKKKRPTTFSSLHVPFHVFSNAERYFAWARGGFECMWQALQVHQGFLQLLGVGQTPRKFPSVAWGPCCTCSRSF